METKGEGRTVSDSPFTHEKNNLTTELLEITPKSLGLEATYSGLSTPPHPLRIPEMPIASIQSRNTCARTRLRRIYLRI